MERGHSPGAYKPLLLAFLSLGLVSLARAQQRRQRVNVVRDEGQVQGTVRLDGGNKDNVKAVVRLEDPQGRIVGEERQRQRAIQLHRPSRASIHPLRGRRRVRNQHSAAGLDERRSHARTRYRVEAYTE